MRHRDAAGTSATLTVVVSDEMTAVFDDESVHPVYGTAALVRHMEQVSRRLLVPHLEDGEEGVGARIEAVHLAPATVGQTVELTASVARAEPRRLVTEIVVRSGGRVVATGSFEQAVVDLEAWRARAGLDPP